MKKLDYIPFIIAIALFAVAFYIYPMLPDQIPTHWNAAGEVDDYSSRPMVYLMPAMVLLIALLMQFLPYLAVFRKNVEQFKHFTGMKIALASFFAVFFFMTIMPNFGYDFNMSTTVFITIGFLFLYIGYIIKDIKRNFWIGIRTPWTLSDDFVWKKTHELGSKVFMIFGVLFFISAFVTEFAIWIIISSIVVLVFATYAYSFVLYKRRHK